MNSAESLPAEQRENDYKVGPGNPPKEYQFRPGQSGNPDGPPKHRTNLWVWFTKYMNMTDAEIDGLEKTKLTQVQHVALNLVEKVKAGERVGSTTLARYIVDREEGKAAEHLILDNGADLSDTECEDIRELLRRNLEGKSCNGDGQQDLLQPSHGLTT
jgi:hypothetical protein